MFDDPKASQDGEISQSLDIYWTLNAKIEGGWRTFNCYCKDALTLSIKNKYIELLQEAIDWEDAHEEGDASIIALQDEVQKLRERWHGKWDRLLQQVREERTRSSAAEEKVLESSGEGTHSKNTSSARARAEGKEASKKKKGMTAGKQGSAEVCVSMCIIYVVYIRTRRDIAKICIKKAWGFHTSLGGSWIKNLSSFC